VAIVGNFQGTVSYLDVRRYCAALKSKNCFRQMKLNLQIWKEAINIEPRIQAGKTNTMFKLVAGKRLLYRPITGTMEMGSEGVARATKGDVTPAGEILRKTSDRAFTAKAKPGKGI
jgi:hypothetical protein